MDLAQKEGAGVKTPVGLHCIKIRALGCGCAVAVILAVLIAPARIHGAEQDGRWAILVAGISGDPELQSEYFKQLIELRDILIGSLKFPKDHVTVLFDDPSKDQASIRAESNWKQLETVCRE
jgi:hypothetical protein